MKNPLQEMADAILKSKKQKPIARPVQAPMQKSLTRVANHSGTVVKSGPGGLLFNFGGYTGNPLADNANLLLMRLGDPVQQATAIAQHESTSKAFNEYVANPHFCAEMENPNNKAQMHKEWEQQLSKSTDQAVKEAFEKGEFDNGGSMQIQGAFNKSEINIAGETLVGQSETDAAVIEMMKSMGMESSADEEEFFIGTEG